jgi:hypothetical protein
LDEAANLIRRQRQKRRGARFNVLERFLLNRVGRRWDKVFAEACEVADARSFHGAEVREYLSSFVATECWLDGKTVMSYDGMGCPQPVRGRYVHPNSGLSARTVIRV